MAGTGSGISAEGKPVVKVFAERAGVAGIPSSIDGIPMEMEVTGKFQASAQSKRYRPMPIGVSVGNNNACAAGTHNGTTILNPIGNVLSVLGVTIGSQ